MKGAYNMSETEQIIAFDEVENKQIQFELSSKWLWDVLQDWAEADALNVKENKEDYINKRVEQLYEQLENEIFAKNVYELAREEGVIFIREELNE